MTSIFCNSGDAKLDALVHQWLKWDKNPETRNEAIDDISHARWDKLKKCMNGRQKFGTAGLRGKMGLGTKCMNDVVILQTAQGLCSYLKKESSESRLKSGIVVGYDGRYNSKRFAELTARVFTRAGIPVRLFSAVCPTPFISFATIKYRCAAGVMVTASHNPKEDNGYKVYWGNGSQIISPHDDNILEEIDQNLDIPDEHWDITDIRKNTMVNDCTEEVTSSYMNYIQECLSKDILEKNSSANIRTVYSAMHGVGHKYIQKAFRAANLKEPLSVKEQQEPDPEFTTVKFPNPEEVGCLEMSQRLAQKEGVNLVLVNDPDADRLAVAEYQPRLKVWKIFSGNEMGALLGWWLLKQYRAKAGEVSSHDIYFIASIVSSKMLKTIAEAEGCQFVETLTGFKWMGNTTLLLAKEGKLPLFAFEEAIGYMCSHRVPDKDGVSAAVQVASLASELYSNGSSLNDQLQALYAQYGYHVSHNSYYICHEPHVIQKIFRRIRNYRGPGVYPNKLGTCEITSIQDFAAGVTVPDEDIKAKHDLTTLGTGLDGIYTGGEMVMFRCSNGLTATVRTSGTEPKIKYYTELVTCADSLPEQEKVREMLVDMVDEIIDELLQPKENGLLG